MLRSRRGRGRERRGQQRRGGRHDEHCVQRRIASVRSAINVAYGQCCTATNDCFGSASCQDLYNCTLNCTSTACVNDCDAKYPAGVSDLNVLESCLGQKCPVCSESGVGDPCVACSTGLSCSGLWCTKPCARSSDCGGLGMNGGNFTGQANACVATPSGITCVPGCASNTDCFDFPGTYCAPATSVDRVAVSVCTLLPDGG